MTHRNARLTVRTRLELVQQVEDGWPQTEVARQFRVSRTTARKWVRRYREEGGQLPRPHTPRMRLLWFRRRWRLTILR